jgi:peptidoglycan hydrolase-like protein with peptidoglycan-binding domain
MRSLLIASVSALALTLGGAAFAQHAQPGATPGNDAAQSGTSQPSAMHKGMAGTSAVRMAQQKLKSAGLYKGKVDGKSGPETMAALKAFQQQNNLKQTGKLDHATKEKLGLAMNSGSTTAPEGSSKY